jgi:hypothetical protein
MWLAATSRALLTLGRLLQTDQPWLQQTNQPWLQQNLQPGSAPDSIIDRLCHPIAAFVWLAQQLGALQQHPTAAAAARVPITALQELRELSDANY